MRLRTRILPAALAAATLLAACQPTPDAGKTADTATRPYGRIAFKPCVITNEQGLPPEEAQCASFPVAENPAQPDGRKIALNIAWLPADNKSGGTPDPVFFLAGGPGPEEGRPAGTVHVGILVRGELSCHELHLDGDPGEVVEAATEQTLGLLLAAMRAAVGQG